MANYWTNKYVTGAVKRLLTTPCNPDGWAWFEALGEAAGMAAFQALDYGDLRHIYHQLTGDALVHDIGQAITGYGPGGAEFGRSIRNTISDAEKQDVTMSQTGLRGVAAGLAQYDALIWYAFLASLATETLINWGTLAFEIAGCQGNIKQFSGYGTWGGGAANLNEWLNVADFDYTTPTGQQLRTGSSVYVPPGYAGYLAIHVTGWEYENLVPAPCSLRIIRDDTGEQLDFDQNYITQTGDKSGALAFTSIPTNEGAAYNIVAQSKLDYPGPNNVAVGLGGTMSWWPQLYP